MHAELARYDDLVHAVYDAVLVSARWRAVVRRIADAVRALRTLLFTRAHAPAQRGFAITHNVSRAALARRAARSMREDPYVWYAIEKGLPSERVAVDGDDLVAPEALRGALFHRKPWMPLDIERVCSGVVFERTDACVLPTARSLARSRRDPEIVTKVAPLAGLVVVAVTDARAARRRDQLGSSER